MASALPADGSGLYIVGSDGSGLRRVAGDDGYLYFGPAWSPDGSTIVVTRFQVGQDGELYLLHQDGSQLTPLAESGVFGYLPSWSPDASKIAFISQVGDIATADVHAITVKSGDETELTDDDAQDYGATWSLDGTALFIGSNRGGTWQILRLDPATLNAEPLVMHAEGNAPTLSPDGSLIAFTSDRDGDDDIYLMNTDGSDQRNLTANEAHDDNAAWSPDGKRIAFSSNRTGKNEIYVLDLASGVTTQLTSGVVEPNIPSWSPDGTMIVFAALKPTM